MRHNYQYGFIQQGGALEESKWCLVLSRLARRYSEWKAVVLREKAIYHVLNLFRADVSGTFRVRVALLPLRSRCARYVKRTRHGTRRCL